ncbi:O-methyltransferase [Micromonospora fulviviridis]|uniref:O-methyltransferase n=1 Tax=Micromonospora fulviviridis TaxID=47860 RepID=UPI00378CA344
MIITRPKEMAPFHIARIRAPELFVGQAFAERDTARCPPSSSCMRSTEAAIARQKMRPPHAVTRIRLVLRALLGRARQPKGARMSGGHAKHVPINQVLREYLVTSMTPPDPAVLSLATATETLGDVAGMMLPVEQAGLLTLLTRVARARTVVDIGTFTGLSALAFALGVTGDGRVITCDNSDRWLDLARTHWERAGVADRIDFRLGPAVRTLRSLSDEGSVDVVFVDADKLNYPTYYDLAVPMLRPGGLLILDNVLLDGYVTAPELAPEPLQRRAAAVMREVNAAVAADDRLESVMLPVADGLTVARLR